MYYNSSIYIPTRPVDIFKRYSCRAYNYASKFLNDYGFFNFFCVSEGGPPESQEEVLQREDQNTV
jgi:hypothetical protein